MDLNSGRDRIAAALPAAAAVATSPCLQSEFCPLPSDWHFELWRRSRDFHAWKRTMWDQDIEMPTQRTVGRSRCFCGAEVTTESVARHIQEAHRGIGDPKTDHKSGS